ncbi:MAG: hypothetical protein II278_09715, partial [Bacteroidaceae bacterium]|nr:hypothetical protein [Bacteroidaceae bacterium]
LDVPELATLEGGAELFDVAGNMSLLANIAVRDVHEGTVDVEGTFDMADETYAAQMFFDSLVVNHYVALEDTAVFSGKASVQGEGLDFFSPHTVVQAVASLSDSRFGKIDLDNIQTDVTLKGQQLLANVLCDNSQLQVQLKLDTELQKHLIDGSLDMDVPLVDIQGMGFSEERMQASSRGTVTFSYDWGEIFSINSHIDELSLLVRKDSVHAENMDLYAAAQKDTTVASFKTGDLVFDFFTPNNVFQLLPRLEELGEVAGQQFKDRNVNLDVLKTYFPDVSLHAAAGYENPLADLLNVYGIRFREFLTDIEMTPEDGVMSNGHVYSFVMDDVMVDTAFFTIMQDTTQLDYRVGVQCHEQPQLPAFRAYLEGFLMADKADAHLTYFDKKDRKGIDLGVKADAADSCVNFSLYPQKPVLAFREFSLNGDNYITTRPQKPIQADVRLKSLTDSCYMAVYADENEWGKQIANLVIDDLNLKELLTIVPVPNLPSMAGVLNLDAYYIDQEENFLVEGSLDANSFVYEGLNVGDFDSQFTYAPQSETVHVIDANLAYNGNDIVFLEGVYDAT